MGKQLLGVGNEVPKDCVIKEISGFEGKYFAGSDGHIYCESNSRRTARLPKPFRLAESMGGNGYFFVTTILNGKRRSLTVHALICRTFYGNRPGPGFCVRHLDGNKLNNILSNLVWGTYSENEGDKRRHGTAAIGSKQGHAKLTEDIVRLIRFVIPRGLWTAKQAAEALGMHPASIRKIVRGVGWKHVK